MNCLVTLLFLFAYSIGIAQEDSVTNVSSIRTFELIGTWDNMINSFNQFNKKRGSKEIGHLSEERITIPTGRESYSRYIRVEADGTFIDLKLPNAHWKLEGNLMVITSQFGQEYKALLQKNDSSHVYRLTLNGETFMKKLK